MKKIFLVLVLFLSTSTLFAIDTLFFKVTLLGIKCAEVEVIENYLDNDVVEIIYHAYTVELFGVYIQRIIGIIIIPTRILHT